jgi:hypothetical protein
MKTKTNLKQSITHFLSIILIMIYVLLGNFESKAQNFQFLLNNALVSDSNTNYTLKAGLLRQYYDSLHSLDTSINSFMPGEKAFK